jgi:hypothetical protein
MTSDSGKEKLSSFSRCPGFDIADAENAVTMEGSMQRLERPSASRVGRTHLHNELTLRVVEQRHGVPHEIRRTICCECGKLLSEEQFGRTSA